MQGSIHGPIEIDAEGVTDHSPGQRPGIADSILHLPEAVVINYAPNVVEG